MNLRPIYKLNRNTGRITIMKVSPRSMMRCQLEYGVSAITAISSHELISYYPKELEKAWERLGKIKYAQKPKKKTGDEE